jgi:GNAT superfamily N-acetyltransferase
MDEITVAPARESEAAACLALLPEAAGSMVELLIAKRDAFVVGAAALWWRNDSDPPGFPLAIHVLPPDRRRGIGRRLLNHAIEIALDDAHGFWSRSPAADGGPAAAFLAACGFAARRREHHFEATFDALLAEVAPRANKLRDRSRVPEDIEIVPLAHAPLEEVGRLVGRELGGAPATVIERLRARAGGSEAANDRSRVALRDGKVEGAILWRVHEGVAIVEARVVHPRHRGGWLNVILLEDGLSRGKAEGLARLRFHCEDTVRDTLALARRCNAVETEPRAYYYLGFAD